MIFPRKAPYFLKKLQLIRKIPLMSFSSDCTRLDPWFNVSNKGSCLVEFSVGSRRFSGSGVVLHDSGLVVTLTTSHMLLRQCEDGSMVDRRVNIRIGGFYACPGRLIGHDASSMVAFVAFKPDTQLKGVSVGLSRVMKPGDEVAFVSSSCPSIGSVMAGCIGSTSCDLGKKKVLSFKGRMPHQISGHGLFNEVGELIGLGMPQWVSRKICVMPIDIVWKILDNIIVHLLKKKVLPVLSNAESWEMRHCKRDPKWLTSVDHVKLEKKFRYLIHVFDGLSASNDLKSSGEQVKYDEGTERMRLS